MVAQIDESVRNEAADAGAVQIFVPLEFLPRVFGGVGPVGAGRFERGSRGDTRSLRVGRDDGRADTPSATTVGDEGTETTTSLASGGITVPPTEFG